MITTRLEAFFDKARPEKGATCTLAHGDFRGDNLFFCEGEAAFPHGWLCIDYQMMFRGPVPSDLAHLMNSGSVLPEVYAHQNQATILRAFYDRFRAQTRRYPNYTFDQFVDEYAMMSTVQFIYFIGFGGPIVQAGAFNNELGMRVELGGKGTRESELPPEEQRQRMWWTKAFANFGATYGAFGLVDRLRELPENHDGLGPWIQLPDHLHCGSQTIT
jgi:hypothetical protein